MSIKITFSNSSTQWNISLDNHFITELNRCMDISDCIYKPNASIILNSLSVSTTRNQIWMIEKKQNYFFIKVVGSADLALTINSQENSVTLDNFNEYDKKQQWILDYQDYI